MYFLVAILVLLGGTLTLPGLAGIVLTPVFIVTGLKILPKTPMGKHLVLSNTESSDKGYTSSQLDKRLIGKTGIALTVLRPSGIVRLENKKYQAVTQGDFIEKDETIEVISIKGIQVVVKKKLS